LIHPLQILDLDAVYRPWARRLVEARWGSAVVVAHGILYRPAELDGYLAMLEGKPLGLLTYQIAGQSCQIVSLDSLRERVGIGSALIAAVQEKASSEGCTRLWLVTTNDNLPALDFYQKRGFRIAAVRPGEVERSRQLKPEIPSFGFQGIPIRDEIELELEL